jgi:hypothetical protein
MTADQKLLDELKPLINCDVKNIEEIFGGRNSKVFKVKIEGESASVAAKKYYFRRDKSHQRCQHEFSSLKYLWECGIRNIPQPIAFNKQDGLALYQFIEGEKVAPHAVKKESMDQVICFLNQLKKTSKRKDSSSIPSAAEACFSIAQIIENIRFRIKRIKRHRVEEKLWLEMLSFLENKIEPFMSDIVTWLKKKTIVFDEVLPVEHRTLSPSDFGFHNAIQSKELEITFIDFEYFGWDDPSKTVVDFVLHPAMELSLENQTYFLKGICNSSLAFPGFSERISTVFPLFGVKWCLILLNEFIRSDLDRRLFVSETDQDVNILQRQQLKKSQHMLKKIKDEYQTFPPC